MPRNLFKEMEKEQAKPRNLFKELGIESNAQQVQQPMQQQKMEQPQSLAGMLGGGTLAQILGGLAQSSPLGTAKDAYNALGTIKQRQEQEDQGWRPGFISQEQRMKMRQRTAPLTETLQSLPQIPEFGEGTAYDVSRTAGNVAQLGYGAYKLAQPAYALGKGLYKSLRTAPTIEKISKNISKAENALGGNLENQIGNIEKTSNKAASELSESLSKQVTETTRQLGGNKTLLENAEQFGNKLKGAYKTQKDFWSNRYDQVFRPYKNVNMFEEANKTKPYEKFVEQNIKKGAPNASEYLSKKYYIGEGIERAEVKSGIPKSLKYPEGLPSGLGEFHGNFVEKPTFDNAHKLLSRTKYEIREMQSQLRRGNLNNEEKEQLHKLIKYKDNLQGKFHAKMNEIDASGKLSKEFAETTEGWAKNVSPYENNPQLSQIVKEGIRNPKKIDASISSLLKGNDIDVVSGHVGEDFGRHVIHHELAKTKNLDHKKMLDILGNLEQKGLDIYAPKGLYEHVGKLSEISRSSELSNSLRQKIMAANKSPEKISALLEEIPGVNNKLAQQFKDIASNHKAISSLSSKLKRTRGDAGKTLQILDDAFVENPGLSKQVPGLRRRVESLEKSLRKRGTLKKSAIAGATLPLIGSSIHGLKHTGSAILGGFGIGE